MLTTFKSHFSQVWVLALVFPIFGLTSGNKAMCSHVGLHTDVDAFLLHTAARSGTSGKRCIAMVSFLVNHPIVSPVVFQPLGCKPLLLFALPNMAAAFWFRPGLWMAPGASPSVILVTWLVEIFNPSGVLIFLLLSSWGSECTSVGIPSANISSWSVAYPFSGFLSLLPKDFYFSCV